MEGDSQFYEPFFEFFDAKFNWHPGEYVMQVWVDTEPKEASVRKSYRFTLFESDSEDLVEYKDHYKYGDGIYYMLPDHIGVPVPITEDKA